MFPDAHQRLEALASEAGLGPVRLPNRLHLRLADRLDAVAAERLVDHAGNVVDGAVRVLALVAEHDLVEVLGLSVGIGLQKNPAAWALLDWDDALLDAIGVPRSMLPAIEPSSGEYGEVKGGAFAGVFLFWV